MVAYDWLDSFRLETQLEPDELMIRDAAREFAQDRLRSCVNDDFGDDYSDPGLFREMGEHGLLGVALPEVFGCAGGSYVALGLVAREIERIDTGYRSMMTIQSNLVMYPILRYGSQEQRDRYLPALARGELIGCFGLTEAGSGSDAGAMEALASHIDGGYRLSGAKAWISSAPIADLLIIWARSEVYDGAIRGFIVEKGAKGLSTKKVRNKLSMRTSINGEIHLDNVDVGREAILPNALGLRAPLDCVNRARYEVSWGILGAAEGCYAAARQHGLDRAQFGRPLAATQLYQKKLADMAIEIGLGLQATLRVGRLIDAHEHTPEMISIVKRNNTGKALDVARKARDMLGSNGLSSGFDVIRHMNNLEAVSTYDGTDDVHTLILGRGITGLSAF